LGGGVISEQLGLSAVFYGAIPVSLLAVLGAWRLKNLRGEA
jgi:hypothetical protein